MDTALPQKFPFILDRNLAKANCTGNRVCTSCDIVVLGRNIHLRQEKFSPSDLVAREKQSTACACMEREAIEGMTVAGKEVT